MFPEKPKEAVFKALKSCLSSKIFANCSKVVRDLFVFIVLLEFFKLILCAGQVQKISKGEAADERACSEVETA